jgi:hypothetical protein
MTEQTHNTTPEQPRRRRLPAVTEDGIAVKSSILPREATDPAGEPERGDQQIVVNPIPQGQSVSEAMSEEDAKALLDAIPNGHLRASLRHHRNCPAEFNINRVEAYPADVPPRFGGGTIMIVRCQECGAHAREDELY